MTDSDHGTRGPQRGGVLSAPRDEAELEKEVTLLELLDRVLDKGVVLSGDITLSVADVDLVYVGLRVLLSSVDAAQRSSAGGASAAVGDVEDSHAWRETGRSHE